MIKLPGEQDTTLCEDIEKLATESNISVMDATIEISTRRGIEIEYAALLIANNASLKARLQVEGEQLNYLKKTKRVAI